MENLTKNQKAISRLESISVNAKEENDTVYVIIEDTELELSQFEIDYQANCFDEESEEED